MSEDRQIVLRLNGITKRFGPLVANDRISLTLERGKVLALLGENGAGKTTLMNILFGHYVADEGDIEIFGRRLEPGSPKEAIAAGIGMVHQHFTLADNMTVIDNIVLGTEPLFALRQNLAAARRKINDLAREFGLHVDPGAKISRLAVGERQRVEILKALYRGARILILDEPTAVLTPQETEALFATLRGMVARGLSVIFISHKLNEVMAIADEIAVLRHGRLVARRPRAGAGKEEIAAIMLGKEIPEPKRTPMPAGAERLRLDGIAVSGENGSGLHDIAFSLRAHEIIGIAGVSGNGQSLLADLISGLIRPDAGSMKINGQPFSEFTPRRAIAAGIGRIPEDRHATGVIGDLQIQENLILEQCRSPRFSAFGWLKGRAIARHAQQLIERFDIRGAAPTTLTRTLSGGNMQKVILARVLEIAPKVILANQPTRGLDVGAATYVHEQLLHARAEGAGIILISEDLEELMTVSDAIAVMYRGRLSAPIPAEQITVEKLGGLMAGHGFGEGAQEETGHAA